MKEYLENFRHDIQKYWDEQTVSPKFLPLDPTKPASAGQCAPTSYVLLQKLRQDFPDKNFTLAIGEVHKQGSVVIDYHVWVVEVCESPKDNRVLDITADQSEVFARGRLRADPVIGRRRRPVRYLRAVAGIAIYSRQGVATRRATAKKI